VLPDGSGRAFLRQDKFDQANNGNGVSGADKETYERRKAAKEAAAAAAAEEQDFHESPGQKIKRQLGLN
jgi:hypothetical protein